MKKVFLIIIFVIVFILTFFIKNYPFSNINADKVFSQIQYSLYILNNDEFEVELSFGEREEPFNDNGKPSKNVKYSLLEIQFKNRDINSNYIFINLKINNNISQYKLIKNPFKNSFIEDIKLNEIYDDNLYINIEDINDNYYNLQCVSKLFNFSYNDAKEKCVNEYKTYLLDKLNEHKNFECYLTIAKGYNTKTVYYWKLKILTTDFETKYALFDVDTLELILKT